MKKLTMILILTAVYLPVVNAAAKTDVNAVLEKYKAESGVTFSAERGEAFWKHGSDKTYQGKPRSCQSCHGGDLKKTGKHIKTGKTIDPMAPSVNTDRFVKQRKIEKWFRRNCKWTLGRECTAQEKGDVLLYLTHQ